VRLEGKVEALAGDWRYGEILGLHGWKTVKYKELDHDFMALAELTVGCAGTCKCSPTESELNRSGFTDPYYIHDIPIRGKRVRIYYRLQRWYCKRCRTSAQQPLPGVDLNHKMTSRLVEYVQRESLDLFRSFSDVADEVGCSEQTVRNIFTRHAKQLEDEELALRRAGIQKPPEWIAIDEVHPQKRVEYCVISAPALHKVLDILPVNEEKELFKWLVRLRPYQDHVKVVSMDMCLEYRKLVRRLLPQALIVVDRYHVHNLLNVALKGVLDVVRTTMTYSERREQMRPEHLLLTSYRKLSDKAEEDERGARRPSPKQLADRWLADVPDIAWAHRLKEEFSDILQLTDREKAEALTDAWLRQVHDFVQYFRDKYQQTFREQCQKSDPRPWPDPFGNVPGTVTEWRNSILNYIDCKSMFNSRTVSNSFAEQVNGRIKKAYRVGHHYSFEVLRIKCVYGGVMVRRRPPHPLDAPRLSVVRGRIDNKKGKKTDPNANLEILKRTRNEADDTRGLLPQPNDHPGFASRFNKEDMEKWCQATVEPDPVNQMEIMFSTEEDEQPPITDNGCDRRSNKPNQLKMF
jgi:transposase